MDSTPRWVFVGLLGIASLLSAVGGGLQAADPPAKGINGLLTAGIVVGALAVVLFVCLLGDTAVCQVLAVRRRARVNLAAASVPPPPTPWEAPESLEIQDAWYGDYDNNGLNVGDLVGARVNGTTLDMWANHDNLGIKDPSPNHRKHLKIDYRLNGEDDHGAWPEDSRVTIPADMPVT